MASLILGAGALAYDQVQKSRAKKKARVAHNSARFSALEQENADRIANLQQNICFCQRSDWRGGECEVHGYVPPAPGMEGYNGSGYMPPSQPPGYDSVNRTERRVDGDGSGGVVGLRQGGEGEARREERRRIHGGGMDEEEVARINEERRTKKRGKKGYRVLFGGKSKDGHNGVTAGVVR
ncbi:MAG: hypothetical protein Q9164_003824 [Protoblastenia rupestris]